MALKGTLNWFTFMNASCFANTIPTNPIDFICATNHYASMSTGGEESGAPRDPRHGGRGGGGGRGSGRGSGRDDRHSHYGIIPRVASSVQHKSSK